MSHQIDYIFVYWFGFFVWGDIVPLEMLVTNITWIKVESPPPLWLPSRNLECFFLQWRGKLPEDCIEITVESRGGAADYQPQL